MVAPATLDARTQPSKEVHRVESGTGAPTSARLRPKLRLLGVTAAISVGAALGWAHLGTTGDRSAGLSEALAADHGLLVEPVDVVWVDGPPGLSGALDGNARALVRGLPGEGEPADIYLVNARLSPEGALLAVGGVYNLSGTTGADESRPELRADRALFVSRSRIPGAPTLVNVLDLAGEDATPTLGWSRMQRTQHAITNLQQTGQLDGIGHHSFVVTSDVPPTVQFADAQATSIVVDAGGKTATVSVGADGANAPDWIRVEPSEPPRPGSLVTWTVDRVRSVPWIGDTTMQAVKAFAFTALDFVLRHKEQLTGDTGEEGIMADLGEEMLAPPSREVPTDPETGWPPAPLETWVEPSLPGEGQWRPKEDASFHLQNPGLPPTFITTYIRTDRSRKATRVYIALWDPRQVELHMMPGRAEPKSATGATGPGTIPRTPEVMGRLVAASNAGFQALHGEYGMMAEGVVYLPPKPYAATVTRLADGSTGFGTWSEDPTVPDEIVSFRQNMTVMVQDEEFNPYGRTWWGGTVPGAEDKTHTVRTGICLTREHFVAYFYGADLSPQALARAMIQTRCKYGLALDMNAGHAGLEYYKAGPADEMPALEQLTRQRDYEGDVPEMEGWRFRRQGMIKGMGLMYPPRYIKREGRDFFYMTLRHLLPGEALPVLAKPAEKGEGAWTVAGLPQHGFPYALATSFLRPDASKPDQQVRLLKIDPKTIDVGDAAEERVIEPAADAPPAARARLGATVALLDAGPYRDGLTSIWFDPAGSFALSEAPPVAGAVRLASGSNGAEGVAAIGVQQPSGMLVYAELPHARDFASKTADDETQLPKGAAALLKQALAQAGCAETLLLERSLQFALGGDTDLDGTAVHAPAGLDVVRLVRGMAPGGQRILTDTPVKPLSHWYPLQQHRVRYFKKK